MRLQDWLHAQNLTDTQMTQVIREYAELNRTGKTGDTLLRGLAERYCDAYVGSYANTILWMDHVATYCYRAFAERYIADKGL